MFCVFWAIPLVDSVTKPSAAVNTKEHYGLNKEFQCCGVAGAASTTMVQQRTSAGPKKKWLFLLKGLEFFSRRPPRPRHLDRPATRDPALFCLITSGRPLVHRADTVAAEFNYPARPGIWRPRKPLSHTRRWPNVALMLGRRRRRRPSIKATLGQRLVFAGKPLSHTAVTDWVITHTGPDPWRKRDVNSKLILVYNNISVVIECVMWQASFVHRVGWIGSLGISLGMTSILIYEITPYFNSSTRDSSLITIPANTGS